LIIFVLGQPEPEAEPQTSIADLETVDFQMSPLEETPDHLDKTRFQE